MLVKVETTTVNRTDCGYRAAKPTAIQLVKNLGAHVTAVCSTEQLALVEHLGAERTIDYRGEDFTKDDQIYDVVFDAAGKSSFNRCKRLLKPKMNEIVDAYRYAETGQKIGDVVISVADRGDRLP